MKRITLTALTLLSFTPAHSGILTLVAGGGTGGDGSKATEAAIGQPFGVAMDKQGNLFIADYTGQRVRKVDASGIITTIAGTGVKGFAGDGGPALQGQFHDMHDLVVSDNGDLYIADSLNFSVRKIDAKTGTLSTVAGTGAKGKASDGDGGPGHKAALDGVASLFFDASGTKLYLTGFSSAVRVLDLQSGIISTVKGLPGGRSVAVDSKGNIYVAGGKTLRVMRQGGKAEVLVDASKARPGEVTLGDNTKHLGFDADENVLIADDFGHAIKRYQVANHTMDILVGTGTKGSEGVGGPPLSAQLNGPHGVYFHHAGKTLYVCDTRNQRVLKVVP